MRRTARHIIAASAIVLAGSIAVASPGVGHLAGGTIYPPTPLTPTLLIAGGTIGGIHPLVATHLSVSLS